MPRHYPSVLTAMTFALMVAIATLAGFDAPAGMRLAIHWNDAGKPDTFAAAWTALFLPVALSAGMTLVLAFLERKLPSPMALLGYATLAFAIVYQAMIAAPVFGIAFPYQLAPLMAVCGLLYIAMGNSLPKTRPVFRAPQTLLGSNRLIASKRFASRFWIVAGLIILAAALAPLDPALRSIAYRVATAVAILPPLFQGLFWRQGGAKELRRGSCRLCRMTRSSQLKPTGSA